MQRHGRVRTQTRRAGPRPAVGGGAAGASAVADAKPRAKPASRKRKAPRRVRAVKVGAGSGRVPASVLATRLAPLTGRLTAGPSAATGSATGPAAGPGTGPPTATGPTTTTPSDAPPSLPAVGVTLDDRTGYSARLSRATVAAGPVVVQLVNQGEDDHNLRIVPTDHDDATADFPLTASGTNATRTLTLKPGTYRLFCTLTTPVNHELAGMNATLTVTAPSS